MSDIDDAMGTRAKRKKTTKRKPVGATPCNTVAPPQERIRQGQTCPKCNRGLIGVVRTRLYRNKNKRVVILGCRSQQCLWDLDGDNVRVSPINPGREVQE